MNKIVIKIGLLINTLIFSLTLSASLLEFRKHNFGIITNVSFDHNRDEQASPLRYSGYTFPIKLFNHDNRNKP